MSSDVSSPAASLCEKWRYCTATVQWNCTLTALNRLGEGKLWYQTSAALRLYPFMWKARGVNLTQIEEWSPLGGIVLNLTQFRQLLHPDYLPVVSTSSCHWIQIWMDKRVRLMLRKSSSLKSNSRASHDVFSNLIRRHRHLRIRRTTTTICTYYMLTTSRRKITEG